MANKILVLVLVAVTIFAVAQAALYHPHLPDKVASHFDLKGEANGFSSKGAYTTLMIALEVGMLLMFLLIALACRYMPASLINMPNKDYWLAPERRDATLIKLKGGMYVMAIATQLLMIAINQLIIWQNLGFAGMVGGSFWIAMGVYLAFTVGWCIWLYRVFRRPAQETASLA